MSKTTYDFVFSSPFKNYEYFAHYMRQHCGQMRLNFFFVNDVWIHEFLAKLRSGEVAVRVLLDLTMHQAIHDNPYTALAREAKAQGAYLIDDPERTVAMRHKGRCHTALLENGIPVPETIVLTKAELANFQVTEEIKRRLGTPFVVKPAVGYGGVGVITNATSAEDVQRCASAAPEVDAFLIQQRLNMKDFGRHKGWFRMFYICGTVIGCWWDPASHEYHMITPAQVQEHELTQLRQIMKKIAQVTQMKKFSSEICMHEDGKLYAVDYVNAAPDMNPQSFYDHGVPDEVVRYIAWLLFYEALHTVKRNQGFFDVELSEVDEVRKG